MLSYGKLGVNIRFTKIGPLIISSMPRIVNFIIGEQHVLSLKVIYHDHCESPNVQRDIVPIVSVFLKKKCEVSYVGKRLRSWIFTVFLEAFVWQGCAILFKERII